MNNYELEKVARDTIKRIIREMTGYTEDDVIHAYIHDIHFHNGFDILVDLFMQAKFNK